MKLKNVYFFGLLLLIVTACNEAGSPTEEVNQRENTESADKEKKVELVFPAISPRAEVQQMIGITKVKVNYSRPSVRERVIWGGLVPYDEVWRTGANAPTTIKFPHDVSVSGNHLQAGKYNLTTIPGANGEWEFIFTGPDGDDNEALRFNVQSGSADSFHEMMTFQFKDVTETSGHLVLIWDELEVGFLIETETHELVTEMIDKAIAHAADDDWSTYSQSARYLIERGERLDEAEEWVNTAIAIEENWRNYFTKGLLREKQGNIDEAIESIEKAIEIGREQEETFGAEGFLLGILERLNEQV